MIGRLAAGALLLAFCPAATTGAADPASDPERPPNFVVIMADDLSPGELGSYGHPEHQTPNLDGLARTGMRFKTCWATPVCSPTRVEILTGRYGFRTGWTNFIGRPTTRQDHLDPDEITFADVLKARGYATGLAGKWQLGRIRAQPNMILDSGFDEYCSWAWMQLPIGARFDGVAWKRRYWHPAVLLNGRHLPTTRDQYGPDIYTDWLIDFIRRHRDQPFLAYYPMLLTHRPWDPTPDPACPGGQGQGGLASSVAYMDLLIGKILSTLDELGLREQTIVLFTGDNATAGPHKGKLTDPGVRVPLIANGPGRVKAGVVSNALIDLSDVLPTLAELAGTSLPQDVAIDGRSFASVLRGENDGVREWIFSYQAYQRMLRDERWLLESDGRLFDCGGSHGPECADVTGSADPDVVAARRRFERLLEGLPPPPDETSDP